MRWTEIWEFDIDAGSHKNMLAQFQEKATEVVKFRGIELEGIGNLRWRLSDGECRVFGTVHLHADGEGDK